MQDEYDNKKNYDFYLHQISQSKQLAGEFKKANFHDNGSHVNEFGLKSITKRSKTTKNLN